MKRFPKVLAGFQILFAAGLAGQDPPKTPAECWCTILGFNEGDTAYTGRRWPGGRVPYVFDSACTSTQRSAARAAMIELGNLAGVDFQVRVSEPSWLHIQPSTVNSSYVGMLASGGAQTVNIVGWQYKGVIQHELLHALGFWHTQQRPDRDGYVTMNTGNIQSGSLGNFNIVPGAACWGEYDFDSIMHYPQYVDGMAVNTSQPVLTVRSPYDTTWANRLGSYIYSGSTVLSDVLSPGDIYGLRAAYGYPVNSFVETINVSGIATTYESVYPAISGDGRYVAFYSRASNLVPNDTNDKRDVFVYDQRMATFERVTVSSLGVEANNTTQQRPVICSDGNLVAFTSLATNLVPGVTTSPHAYLRNRSAATTTLISQSTSGQPANGSGALVSSMSADGRYVAFTSNASNLVSGDTNGVDDVFVRDLVNNTTTRASLGVGGAQGNDRSWGGLLSQDGHYIAWTSDANNLASGDTNNAQDVFLRDLRAGVTWWITSGSNANSSVGGVTPDGGVYFGSAANNLVLGDTNNFWDAFFMPHGGSVRRISFAPDGGELNGDTGPVNPQGCSREGRYVLLSSTATNLGFGNSSGARFIYVLDMVTGLTTLASTTDSRPQVFDFPNAECANGALSEDGRFVAYQSYATNIVSPNNGLRNVFLRSLASRPEDYRHTGPACFGSTWRPEIFLTGWPMIGNDGFGFMFWNAMPSMLFGMVFSLAEGNSQIGSCYIGVSLQAIGATLYTVASASGDGSVQMAIPNNVRLLGASLYAQGFSLDQSGPLLGTSLTTTQRVRVQN